MSKLDEYQADRIRNVLHDKHIQFEELRMMGGLCFMVDEKMCIGLTPDKKEGYAKLMIRAGEDQMQAEIEKEDVIPMDFKGRSMKGYGFVLPDGYDLEDDLEYYVDICLKFNPLAKKSKKKKS